MSGKLDQSLDEIATTQRRGRRNPRRSAARAAPVPAAPAGGVKKNTKPARNAAGARAGPIKTGPVKGDSKIIVSNLVSVYISLQAL
jgi:THO complex subunit 4